MNYISFPGLGIGEFRVDRIAFSLFGKEIAWYALIIVCGMLVGFFYAVSRLKFEKVSTDDFLDLVTYMIPAAIVCARLYYVVFDPNPHYESFIDYIAIWRGGIAIYGALIGGALTVVLFARRKKIKAMKLLDIVSPAALIGQAIGRWGNFVNAEAHGGQTESFFRMGIRSEYASYASFYHPTFLYESLWNAAGVVLIHLLYKKKRYDGQVFLLYATWYGLGRFWIEGMRTDSLYIGTVRVSQLVAGLCVAAGLALLIVFQVKIKKSVQSGEK